MTSLFSSGSQNRVSATCNKESVTMPEQPPNQLPTGEQVQAHLHELAEVLREAHHLEPEAQEALADLVEELGKALTPTAIASHETAQLANTAAHLARALHQEHNPTLLSAAKQRLEQAALRAEAQAPVATGIARRLLDALANLGI
jgi:hypothetical protein